MKTSLHSVTLAAPMAAAITSYAQPQNTGVVITGTIMKMTAKPSSWLNFFQIILLASLTVLISGCQSVQEASSVQKQQATSFTPPPGLAGLYVIRPWHHVGCAVNWGVRLDYQYFGTVETKSYLYSPILPGKHFLRVGASGDSRVKTFIAKAGENYYFSINPHFGGCVFDQDTEADGQRLVRKFKMSGATSYKVPFNP